MSKKQPERPAAEPATPPAPEPPTRAAEVRAAIARFDGALQDLDAALRLPPHGADRFAGANAVLLALSGADRFPGPGDRAVDERAAATCGRLSMRMKANGEWLERYFLTLRRAREELSAAHVDPAFPTLRAADFAGGLSAAQLPASGGHALVGRWDALAPDHPARQYLSASDAVAVPGEGAVLALAWGTFGPPAHGVELSEVLHLTRAVAADLAGHRARVAEQRRREAAVEAARLAADPLYQVELLKRQVAELQAGRADLRPVG